MISNELKYDAMLLLFNICYNFRLVHKMDWSRELADKEESDFKVGS